MKSSIETIRQAAISRYQDDLDLLKQWVNQNSGSHHLAGNKAMLHAVATRFASLPGSGGIHELIHPADAPSLTNTYQACYRHRCREDAPVQILLNGHLDTVFDENHPFQEWKFLENGLIQGPGITDMKGGIIVMLAALEIFESIASDSQIGWEILITCDEEVGSLASKPLLLEAAERNHLGITFESSLPDGKLVRKRMGVGYAHAKVSGKSAHVGRNFNEGKNAIIKLCEWIARIHALNDNLPGIIVNTGSIHGGGPLNVVTEHAEARFNLRVENAGAEQRLFEAFDHIFNDIKEPGYNCLWEASLNRKAKETGPAFDMLFGAWNRAATMLGIELGFRDTGGASDGNILQEAGLPIIDNLGVLGDRIHSPEEYLIPHSLTERTILVATFMQMLNSGQFDEPFKRVFAHRIKELQMEQNRTQNS